MKTNHVLLCTMNKFIDKAGFQIPQKHSKYRKCLPSVQQIFLLVLLHVPGLGEGQVHAWTDLNLYQLETENLGTQTI